jgi:hypothetical protein
MHGLTFCNETIYGTDLDGVDWDEPKHIAKTTPLATTHDGKNAQEGNHEVVHVVLPFEQEFPHRVGQFVTCEPDDNHRFTSAGLLIVDAHIEGAFRESAVAPLDPRQVFVSFTPRGVNGVVCLQTVMELETLLTDGGDVPRLCVWCPQDDYCDDADRASALPESSVLEPDPDFSLRLPLWMFLGTAALPYQNVYVARMIVRDKACVESLNCSSLRLRLSCVPQPRKIGPHMVASFLCLIPSTRFETSDNCARLHICVGPVTCMVVIGSPFIVLEDDHKGPMHVASTSTHTFVFFGKSECPGFEEVYDNRRYFKRCSDTVTFASWLPPHTEFTVTEFRYSLMSVSLYMTYSRHIFSSPGAFYDDSTS